MVPVCGVATILRRCHGVKGPRDGQENCRGVRSTSSAKRTEYSVHLRKVTIQLRVIYNRQVETRSIGKNKAGNSPVATTFPQIRQIASYRDFPGTWQYLARTLRLLSS